MLATQLNEESERIRAGRSLIGADSFDVAWRELARDLFQAVERGEPDADDADRFVIASMMTRRRDELGAWIDSTTSIDSTADSAPAAPLIPVAAIQAAARELDALRINVDTLSADAIRRGVRDALAPMWALSCAQIRPHKVTVQFASPSSGWIYDAGALAAIERVRMQNPWTGNAPAWMDTPGKGAVDRVSRLFAIAHTSPAHASGARWLQVHASAAIAFADVDTPLIGLAGQQALRVAASASLVVVAPEEDSSTTTGTTPDVRTHLAESTGKLVQPLARPLAQPLARLVAWSEVPPLVVGLPVIARAKGLAPDPAKTFALNLQGLLAESAATSSDRARLVADLLRTANQESPDETALPRQLRVIYRQLEPALKQSRRSLIETAERALSPATSLADPALLSAMGAHRRRDEDLAMLMKVGAILSQQPVDASDSSLSPDEANPNANPNAKPDSNPNQAEGSDEELAQETVSQPAVGNQPTSDSNRSKQAPRVRTDMAPAAVFMLRIGQDLAKPDIADAALAEYRDAAKAIIAGWDVLGEARMRTSGDAQDSAIIKQLDAARSAYLLALADPRRRDLRVPASDIAAIGLAISFADSIRVDSVMIQGLVAWPGFEASPRALGELRDVADAAASRVLEAIAARNAPSTAGSTAAFARAVTTARDDALAWRVVASLARAHAQAVAGTDAEAGSGAGASQLLVEEAFVGSDAVAECVAGALPVQSGAMSAWMAAHATEIAELSRWAEEWALAKVGKDAAMERIFGRMLNETCKRLEAVVGE